MTENYQCDIFISYRRVTGRDMARTLQLDLERRGYSVFFDYDSVRDGEFNKKIFLAIERCRFFIAFYSEHSLDGCVDENDWVRLELEYALRLKKKIIPVMPSDLFPSWKFPESLPACLHKLRYIEISEISMGSLFKASVSELIDRRLGVGMSLGTSEVLDRSLDRSPANVEKESFLRKIIEFFCDYGLGFIVFGGGLIGSIILLLMSRGIINF